MNEPGPDAAGDGGPAVVPEDLPAALEAVLMVVEEPVDDDALAAATRVPVADVSRALVALAEEYRREGRGFELRRIGGGWRFYSAPAHADVVERFVLEGQTAKLTQAALETLAIVAYRQPVSRARVSAIRGVSVDAVMRTLVTRGLVEESGVDPASGAILYRTTSYFLERMGMQSLEDLAPLAPLLPDVDALDDISPTQA